MPDGYRWQYPLFQVYGRVGHAPAQAGWAKAALFAAERYDLGVAPAPAHEVEAAVLEDPALEILLEFTDDELRQPARVLYALAKCRPPLSDRLVERSLLGPAAP